MLNISTKTHEITMSMFKVPFLLSIVWGMRVTIKPPKPPPSSEELFGPRGWEVVYLIHLLKAPCWGLPLLEVAAILASHYSPSHSNSLLNLLVYRESDPESLSITPLFICGWLCNLFGALVRIWCYRTMGRHFTFELTIRKNHELITTGPYQFVRHPGYAGAFLSATGAVICYLDRGSWAVRCSGLVQDSYLPLVLCWFIGCLLGLVAIVPRFRKEDEMMKKQFGKQWEIWVSHVKYWVIPGVY